jgi:microcystin-dependent protein
MKKLLAVLLALLFATDVYAGTVTRPAKSFGGSSFINGVVPQASDFNGDNDTIYAEFNGNIENANIKSSAAIALSKINTTSGFTVNVRSVNNAPCEILDESDQGADLRRWAWCSVGGEFRLGTYTDADVLQNNWLTITRANGGFTAGGTSGTNVINGATTFNQAVTFAGSNTILPTAAITQYMGTTAPSGWLLMDGASNSCTGGSSVNVNLCTQLVSLVASVNYKGASSATVTSDFTSDEIIHTAHGKAANDRVHFSTTTTLPAPLSNSVVYCIISVTTDRYKVGTVCGGSVTDLTTNGTGTHSDYFNFLTPDARGRVAVGTGTGAGLTARVIGATGGAEDAIVVTHNHGITDPTHVHSTPIYAVGGSSSLPDAGSHDAASTAFVTDAASTGITVNNTGSSGTGANMDPFMVITYIIKL